MTAPAITLQLPQEFIHAVAVELADELERRGLTANAPASPWLTTTEAAAHLRCSKQRVFDLTSQGRLRVAEDGSRSLDRREWLDAYVAGGDA